jgi:hypothetical protein
MPTYRNTVRVPSSWAIKCTSTCRGIAQKTAYDIQNTLIVWNQELCACCESCTQGVISSGESKFCTIAADNLCFFVVQHNASSPQPRNLKRLLDFWRNFVPLQLTTHEYTRLACCGQNPLEESDTSDTPLHCTFVYS